MNKRNSPVVQTFLEIVQIDSPVGHEKKMIEYTSNRLKSYGLNPHIDKEGNVHVFLHGDQSLEPIFLNAHLDTVEPGRGIKPQIDGDGWIKSDGNTILGADNKASVAAILDTVRKLNDTKKGHRPLDIFFTVSEETNSHGSINFDYSRLKAKNGYAFDVSSEDFGTVIISAPFYNRIEINLHGLSAHAKNPEKAANVLPVFIKAMSELPLGRYSPNTVVNMGIINGGTAINAIPSHLTMRGEIRSVVETELQGLTDRYRQVFEETIKGTGVSLDFKYVRENPGYKIASDDPFLAETILKLKDFGLNPEIKDSFGCADANFFAAHGLTTLDIADGSFAAHTVNEKIRVSDLEKLSDLVYFLSTQ